MTSESDFKEPNKKVLFVKFGSHFNVGRSQSIFKSRLILEKLCWIISFWQLFIHFELIKKKYDNILKIERTQTLELRGNNGMLKREFAGLQQRIKIGKMDWSISG